MPEIRLPDGSKRQFESNVSVATETLLSNCRLDPSGNLISGIVESSY